MGALNSLQAFISQYQVLFVSIGVPILTVLISWFVAVQTNRTSRRMAEKERALGVQLKLAEFRQEWINGLRVDLAAYSAATFHSKLIPYTVEQYREVIALGARMVLRMNPKDPDFEKFKTALSNALPGSTKEADETKVSDTVVAIGQSILKREWERLKSDLAEIDRPKAR